MRWTCSRCEMTVSWSGDTDEPRLPSSWSAEEGSYYCLACRRDRAGDDGVNELPVGAAPEERHRRRAQARIDFEIQRDPSRADTRIASACHTSTLAVRRARARLGLEPSQPA